MPPINGNGLQDELEFLLAEVDALANRLRIVSRSLHTADKMPIGGKTILQTLAQAGSQTVPQIARGRSSSRHNIQVLINRLETDGWVEFAANPAHKRSDLIRLTERGGKLLAAAIEREAAFLADLLKHTSEAEVLSAGNLLSRLRQLLGGSEPMPVVHLIKTTAKRPHPKKQIQKGITQLPKPAPEPVAAEEEYPINLL